MKTEFRGSYVALITPFQQNGELDQMALRKLVQWQLEQGTDGILCCGSTGEGVVLSDVEKMKVVSLCLEVVQTKIPILVATGSSSTRETIRLTEQMQKLGVAGALVVTPYYNKPTARGCVAHFREVTKVGLPIIPYYNPKRTGCILKPEVFAEIGAIQGVIALKDSSGDLEFTRKVRSFLPILVGDDDCTLEALQEGAIGAISVIGNVFPGAWKEMIEHALQAQWDRAAFIYRRYLKVCKAMFIETNPQCIKWAAHWLISSPPYLRLPLMEVEELTKGKIRQQVVQLGLPHLQAASECYRL